MTALTYTTHDNKKRFKFDKPFLIFYREEKDDNRAMSISLILDNKHYLYNGKVRPLFSLSMFLQSFPYRFNNSFSFPDTVVTIAEEGGNYVVVDYFWE